MKVTSFFKMSVLAAGMVAAMGANAEDGTITVSGTVIAAGCEVDAASIAAPIVFNDLDAGALSTVGTISDKQDINIALTACPVSQAGVMFTASGTADATNNQLLALSGDSVATGMGIAIYNKDGDLIPMNSASAAAAIDAETGTATIALQAAVMSTAVVTAGTFAATTNFSLIYN